MALDNDDPNSPGAAWRKPRRPLPAILRGSGLGGAEAPYLSAAIALAVCILVWYAFKRWAASESARAQLALQRQLATIRELETKRLQLEAEQGREAAGLPTQASQYRNATNSKARDVKGAPRDQLAENLTKA